jgi:hypothetical protein
MLMVLAPRANFLVLMFLTMDCLKASVIKPRCEKKKDPQWLKPTYVNRVKFDQVVYSLDWLIQLKQGAGIHFDQCGKQIPIEFVSSPRHTL